MAKKTVPFYTESSKKSISLGNAEPDHFEFSDKKTFEPQVAISCFEFVFPFLLMKSLWKIFYVYVLAT